MIKIRLKPFSNYDSILEYLENNDVKLGKLGRDWQGNWIVYANKINDFLVTAGSHGDEHAGVVAAVNLAIDLGFFQFQYEIHRE